MKIPMPLLALSTGLALAACSAPQPNASDTAADTATTPAAAPAAAPASSAATPSPAPVEPAAATAQPAATTTETPAAEAAHDGTAATSGTQAGWYSGGTFRACGSTAALKVDNTADIERQIKAGGMSAGDPVYVKLEGMPMAGNTYMLTRVVQVGSKTPVRDCPMTGTTIQSGG